MNKIVFFFLLASFSFGQNIELYLSLIEEGKVEGVKENLPELSSKYPNNPGVIYLKAILTQDGNSAIKLYQDLLKKHPDSKYASYSAMKIGEYFYARGLYSQAGRQLSHIPREYPRLPNMQKVLDMMVSSFLAIGITILLGGIINTSILYSPL